MQTKEQIKATRDKYYQTHKEEICKKQKEYKERKKEERKKQRREYYLRNKEYIDKQQQEYVLKNKEAKREYDRLRYQTPERKEQCKRIRIEYRNKNYIQMMLKSAKTRCDKNGMEFSIAEEDLTIPTHCPYMGMELTQTSGTRKPNPSNMSLDRVDNSRGYVKGNVQIISVMANLMKRDATVEELIEFAKGILNTHL